MAKSTQTGRFQGSATVDQLANRFLSGWVEANGVLDSRVQVLTGEDGLVILIEGAFTRAERLLASRERADNSLRQYLNGLMNLIGEEALSGIGTIAGQPIHSIGTDVNFDQGWVMWYVRLGELHL